MSGLGFNPIPHEQNYSVSYMIGGGALNGEFTVYQCENHSN